MSPRFDEVARLKNLLGRRDAIIERENDTRTVNHGLIEKLAIERYISAASPWLLEVAGCFQIGDAEMLGAMATWTEEEYSDVLSLHARKMLEFAACLRRMQKAAEIMEEEG